MSVVVRVPKKTKMTYQIVCSTESTSTSTSAPSFGLAYNNRWFFSAYTATWSAVAAGFFFFVFSVSGESADNGSAMADTDATCKVVPVLFIYIYISRDVLEMENINIHK